MKGSETFIIVAALALVAITIWSKKKAGDSTATDTAKEQSGESQGNALVQPQGLFIDPDPNEIETQEIAAESWPTGVEP